MKTLQELKARVYDLLVEQQRVNEALAQADKEIMNYKEPIQSSTTNKELKIETK